MSKTADGDSANQVAGTPGTEPPAFDDQDEDTMECRTEATREGGGEHKAAATSAAATGDNVGDPVTATDPDPNERRT